jgi:hypothetical protein
MNVEMTDTKFKFSSKREYERELSRLRAGAVPPDLGP